MFVVRCRCAKKTGLKIKDIKKFVAMVQEGPASYAGYRELFEERQAQAEGRYCTAAEGPAMMKLKC